jgi:hypothetical protein
MVWVVFLAGCATSSSVKTAKYERAELAGTWRLTMPAGHVSEIKLTNIDRDTLLIAANNNLTGRYRLDGQSLLIVDPSDERMKRLRWFIKDENEMVLTDAPSVSEIGSNYVGATLTR